MPSSTKRLNLKQKEELRAFHKANAHLSQIQLREWVEQQYGVTIHRTNVGRILKDDRQLESAQIDEDVADSRFNLKAPRSIELDSALLEWVQLCRANNIALTDQLIQEKAKSLTHGLLLPPEQLVFSKGWLSNFKRRLNLRCFRLHGESLSVNPSDVTKGRQMLLSYTLLYDKQDIFNLDECGLLYDNPPSTSIARSKSNGIKKSKKRITVAVAANAAGTEKLKLFFIGRAKKPRCFGRMTAEQMNFYCKSNKKAWMTLQLFGTWIQELDERMRADRRQILLVLDNASSHNVQKLSLSKVQVLMLPPNLTSEVQEEIDPLRHGAS
ncbi:hypothetical protein AeMF1_005813 [Aphanomyces euteiches]|nr:hypothetical protein AeMF1_005813 [Aphanomyces euteiches]